MATENKKTNFKEKIPYQKTEPNKASWVRRSAANILKDAKDALQYFDNKVKFAKNKPYHLFQLNKIIRLNNAFDHVVNQDHSEVINALLLALLRHKLNEEQDLHLALSSIGDIIQNPQYAKAVTILWLEDIELQQRLEETDPTPDTILDIINIENMDGLVDEILKILNETVRWAK